MPTLGPCKRCGRRSYAAHTLMGRSSYCKACCEIRLLGYTRGEQDGSYDNFLIGV